MDFETPNPDVEDDALVDFEDDGGYDSGYDLSADAELDAQSLKEFDQLEKGKGRGRQSSRRSLEMRRAIEEHLENKRLRKELDYLMDEYFLNEVNPEEKS